jgi:hypothetical protein
MKKCVEQYHVDLLLKYVKEKLKLMCDQTRRHSDNCEHSYDILGAGMLWKPKKA